MPPVLQFLGAARTVTGSKFLMYAAGQEVLVDCGLFQGQKELRLRNWDAMPIDAGKIDALVLTHGHIDHCGFLPRLVKLGFRGPVWCSPATKALAELMLPDSARVQEEEAAYANRAGYSKHKPALPLYSEEEANAALRLIRSVPYGKTFAAAKGIDCLLHPSGHILGAAFVEMNAEGVRTVFSGDLGGYDCEVMMPPAPLPPNVDYLLVEATYGGRAENERPVRDQLEQYLKPALVRGGIVVIPAFAVGRTTLVLYHLKVLMDEGRIPAVPVFVDSPMATDAVELYCRFGNEHNLRVDLLKDPVACPIRTSDIHLVRSVDESKRLNGLKGPAIIVAASGMATGGRVLHHLKRRLPEPQNLALLVGYQAQGTRGRLLLDGARELKMLGGLVPVRAQVASIRGLSAHGDAGEVLRWMKTASNAPRRTFLVHGEEDSIAAMGRRVSDELGWEHHAPAYLERVELP